MYYVDNGNITDPRINLAIEEHLLRNVKAAPLLLFYINEPSVIIGRNQNTAEEIDPDFVRDNDIHVVRRLSGGGAVYHDLGNLNFSFITVGKQDLHDFTKFTEPVVSVLRKLGLNAELKGKSDIFADGKKISGNAQYAAAGRMFSHGTLLFDTDLEQMLKALNPRQAKIESKAVQSIRSFVANIRELLPATMEIQDLKSAILEGIFGTGDVPSHRLSSAEWDQINAISAERYTTWEWNFGRSPQFNFQKRGQFASGTIDVRLNVAQGVIQNAKIYGSFAGQKDVIGLEARLAGVRHDRETLAKALSDLKVDQFLGELSLVEFLDLLY